MNVPEFRLARLTRGLLAFHAAIADDQRRAGVHVIETSHTFGFLAPANRRPGKPAPEAAA